MRPLSDDPERFVVGAEFMTDEEPSRPLTIAEIREHKEGILLRFEQVVDRNAADRLRGTQLTIAPSDRRELQADEYWPEDLVGLVAFDTEGAELGAITRVVAGPAQDRLEVTTPSGSKVEVPFVEALVPEIDLAESRAVLDPPPGLFAD